MNDPGEGMEAKAESGPPEFEVELAFELPDGTELTPAEAAERFGAKQAGDEGDG